MRRLLVGLSSECLDGAAAFWRVQALVGFLDDGEVLRAKIDRTWRLLAYALVARIEGWRRFGAETGMDVGALWDCFPWAKTVYEAERVARGVAFSPEAAQAAVSAVGVEAHAGEQGVIEVIAQAVTPESVAEELRLCLAKQTEPWE